jgi:predicted Zn-dependent peptidase
MEKYFGTIPARKSPQQAITVEPKQRGEKRIRVSFDAQPQILMGWHKPTFPDRDMFVFEVIQYLMTSAGRSARLYERLVKTDAVCESIESFTGPGDKYPNMYCVWAFPRAPHTTSEVEKAVLEEVERLKTETVGEQELEKVRNQIDASFIKDLETNLGLAKRLGYYYIASKDPDILDKMREQMRAVTAQDVMRVAQKYLSAGNRTVAELQMNQSAGPASHSPMQADTKPTDRETSPSGNHGETGK